MSSYLQDSNVDRPDRTIQTPSRSVGSMLLTDGKSKHATCPHKPDAMPMPNIYLTAMQTLEADISALEKHVQALINQRHGQALKDHNGQLNSGLVVVV